ncbi:uncharacterized protein LOC133744818 [Rosa rugosa]|uniref:uncharacterized protein LOC133744818 n=1 Tax=Rosa rugosa TaxID=74645 RepID=UPI002B40090B|nr:uncharacterized protein LOC133744818 [Rosa rugosa]
MSTRKFECGFDLRRRIEKLIQSKKGALDKYVTVKEKATGSVEETVASPVENSVPIVEEDVVENVNVAESVEPSVVENLAESVEPNVVENLAESVEPSVEENLAESVEPNLVERVPQFNDVNTNIFDPSQWKNIDANLRNLLVEKGPIRHKDLDFPKDEKSRHFASKHYTCRSLNGEIRERIWLVYSKDLDRVFCFCCKLFNAKNSRSQLANEGFRDWQNLSDRLKGHERSIQHVTNMCSWFELEERLLKNKTIDRALQQQVNKEKVHWRKVLKRIIAVVKGLSKNNLAFRGTNEKIGEDNNEIFLSFIETIGEFDPIMKEHLQRIKDDEIHSHYLGPKIQNELIDLLASEIKTEILRIVKEAKYFSIILDCTPDISKREQMTLILRCVNISKTPAKLEEYFLEFLRVDDTTGKGLFDELISVIAKLELDINDARGQGYDNGSNMKGKHQGVQKRLLEINPRAFYTPCGSHNLNLVLSDMANSCPKAKTFFGIVQKIYVLFSSSTKRWKILEDNVSDLTIKALATTRWESRVESVKAIRYQAPQIRAALQQLANVDDLDGALKCEVEMSADYAFANFEFLLGMIILYDMLYAVDLVSKKLQSKDMDIGDAIKLLEGLSLVDTDLKVKCLKLEEFLTHDNVSDIDGSELHLELRLLTEMLNKDLDQKLLLLKEAFQN